MPIIKAIKLYEYEFNFDLNDVLIEVFERTGFIPSGGEKGRDYVKIRFTEELTPMAIQALENLIKSKVPNFKFKTSRTIQKSVNQSG